MHYRFLGANAPLGPASSEALYVCLYVCMYVCNILTPLPLPLNPRPFHTPCQYICVDYLVINMFTSPVMSKYNF